MNAAFLLNYFKIIFYLGLFDIFEILNFMVVNFFNEFNCVNVTSPFKKIIWVFFYS